MRRAFVLSPFATFPPDAGQRRRTLQTTRLLKEHGYAITFALYAFEEGWKSHANEAWLAGVLNHGVEERSLSVAGSAEDTARMIISTLEGAMLVARPYGDVARFDAAADQLLASLAAR